jgi:hypothetical protein
VHLSVLKNFLGLYPGPPFRRGRKAKGRVGPEGMEGKNEKERKMKGKGREGGEGRRIVKDCAPLN